MIAAFALAAVTYTAPIDAPLRWNPSAWSSTITPCDRLAAHPSDPDKLVPGVSQAELLAAGADLAIKACEEAVAADPQNPRQAYRDRAVAGDYAQALFVVGYVYLTGNGAPKDVCKAAPLIRRSALAGRFAGLVGYPHYVATGVFAGCRNLAVNVPELLSFLDRAKAHSENDDYYRGILIDNVRESVARLSHGRRR
jgi:hypothetical protein